MYKLVHLHLIDTNDPLNGRLTLDEQALAELTQDMQSNGLLHPITLAVNGERYDLIAGKRRLAAAHRLTWETIAATVLNVDEHKQAELRFLENATRSALSPVEEARQLANMLEEEPQGVDAIAKRIGRRPEWVQDRLEMISWPKELMYAVHNKQISLGAAQRLARIQPDPLRESRIEFAKLHGINVRTAQLWLTDSQTNSTLQPDMSFNSRQTHPNMQTTETRFHCCLCQQAFLLEHTLPVRVCGPCLNVVKMQQAHQDSRAPEPVPLPNPASAIVNRPGQPMLGPHEQYPGDNDQADAQPQLGR